MTKRREIELATTDGLLTVMATEVVPGLAVHSESAELEGYTVTHIPTGYAIAKYLAKSDAFKVARAIADLVDWPALSKPKLPKRLRRRVGKVIKATTA